MWLAWYLCWVALSWELCVWTDMAIFLTVRCPAALLRFFSTFFEASWMCLVQTGFSWWRRNYWIVNSKFQSVSLSGPDLEEAASKLTGALPGNIASFLSGLETYDQGQVNVPPAKQAQFSGKLALRDAGDHWWRLPQRLHHSEASVKVLPGHTDYTCTSGSKASLPLMPLRIQGNPLSQLKGQ